MHLCIDIGTDHVKCGLFQDQQMIQVLRIHHLEELKQSLQNQSFEKGILVCNDLRKTQEWSQAISSWGIRIQAIKPADFSKHVIPTAKDFLLPDTIAKIYGALSRCPANDCLVIDFGTTVRFELISKQGILLGRSIFPFFDLLYQSLNIEPCHFQDQIPAALGLTPPESMHAGCFFGLLGSIERIVSEIRLASPNPSELTTIGTGTLTENVCWKNPLHELIDYIYPYLTLEGLNQILNEGKTV